MFLTTAYLYSKELVLTHWEAPLWSIVSTSAEKIQEQMNS